MKHLRHAKILALILSSTVLCTTQSFADATSVQQNQTLVTQATPTQTITTVSDSTLIAAVKTVLGNYASKITVTATAGNIHLAGQLDSDTDYEKVVTLAESIQGVQDVDASQLTVKQSQSPLQDTYLTAKAKGAILKSDILGKNIPSWSIGVETKNGKVYLSGKVSNLTQKQKIINIVQSLKGVVQVVDEMQVVAATNPNQASH